MEDGGWEGAGSGSGGGVGQATTHLQVKSTAVWESQSGRHAPFSSL